MKTVMYFFTLSLSLSLALSTGFLPQSTASLFLLCESGYYDFCIVSCCIRIFPFSNNFFHVFIFVAVYPQEHLFQIRDWHVWHLRWWRVRDEGSGARMHILFYFIFSPFSPLCYYDFSLLSVYLLLFALSISFFNYYSSSSLLSTYLFLVWFFQRS